MCQPALSPTPFMPQFWICSEPCRLVCACKRGEGSPGKTRDSLMPAHPGKWYDGQSLPAADP